MTHLACWAHARREFEKALGNNPPGIQKALLVIQELYKMELKAKEEQLSRDRIKELRLQKSLPVNDQMGNWIFEEIKTPYQRAKSAKRSA